MRNISGGIAAYVVSFVSRGLAALVLAVTLLGATAAYAQSFVFSSIAVQGNTQIESASIVTLAALPLGQAVSAGDVNDAVQRIRESGFFESVDAVPNGSTLVIRVVEYPVINRINIEGNNKLKDADLLKLVQSQPRHIYNPSQAEADAAAMAQAYADKGRVNASVTPRIIRLSDNRVDLVFEVFEGGVTEVQSIGFVGNQDFSDRRLRMVLDTKQSGILHALIQKDNYSADRVAMDRTLLTDFYHSRGYPDFVVQSVDVRLTEARDAYLITYNVVEGQKFTFGDVTVASDLPDVNLAEFQSAIRLHRGVTYSPTLIDADITRMERLAVQKGLNFIKIEPKITRDDRNLTLGLTYQISRGERVFIERIDISGNTTTLDRVIRNQFTAAEGDPFNPRAIREAAARIRALGYFANADVQARQGTAPDQVIVDVNVTEQPTGSLSFGANYSTDAGLGLVASFRESNFLGRGQQLSFSISTAKSNRNFGFNFTEPNLLGRDLALGLNLSYKTTTNQNALYDTQSFTFAPSLSFPLGDNSRLKLGYNLNYSEISNVSTTDPYILADQTAGGRWTNSVDYTYSYDTRRTGLNPNAGVLLQFGQEFGFGDVQYIATTARAVAETKVLNEEVTLRASLQGGALSYTQGSSRITDRYFLGSNYLRGFKPGGIGPRYIDGGTNDALGGNYYAVASFEAEFPLGLPTEYGVTGGAFIDYGSVWDTGLPSDPKIFYNDFTPRTVIGLSIFWKTPVGPLRFNFTRALSSETYDQTKNFDVTVSTNF
ncbi:MAG: outer membrane protein assembly factor BamA [Limimaricola sp.]|uniref:outer membrane protein assembly factor BamA n=1 Tax=Limimaricola sp. TaxID=2211665 RepID=UPI001E0DEE8C|nr:outer membrane protein assembly factor BamA [Limimaricola sp.]MBI1418014.1 outer membrane protein assembly factor BamA [Limimaricola sp.]